MPARRLMMVLTAGLVISALASDASDDAARLRQATQVFQDVMRAPDHGIPHEVLEGAQCVAIVPGQKTLAFAFGGTYGKGIATCRNHGNWGAPMFVQVGGGSWGLQIGGQSTDVIMIFRDREGLDHLLRDRVRIGGAASAAAGPIGRDAAAATDASMHAEILTYARSRGVFAGISLDGDIVQPDQSGDSAFYGAAAWQDILAGRIAAPDSANRLLQALGRYSPAEQ